MLAAGLDSRSRLRLNASALSVSGVFFGALGEGVAGKAIQCSAKMEGKDAAVSKVTRAFAERVRSAAMDVLGKACLQNRRGDEPPPGRQSRPAVLSVFREPGEIRADVVSGPFAQRRIRADAA